MTVAQKLSKHSPACMPSKPSPFWTKRLGFALIISVALHLLLVKGLGLEFADWWKDLKTPYSTIDAVLVPPPKPESPKVVAAAHLPTPAAKPAIKRSPKAVPPRELPPAPMQDQLVSPGVEPTVEAAKPDEGVPIEQAAGVGEVNNGDVDESPKPPTFVETDFAVSKGGTKGEMHNSYKVLPDGSYVLKSEVGAKGLASLFLGKLKQRSEGMVTERGLKPSSYFYQYGDNEDKMQRASFNWQAGELTMQNGKKTKTASLA